MGQVGQGALGAALGLVTAFCFVILTENGGLDARPLSVCTDMLTPKPFSIFGLAVSASAQRYFVFVVLVSILTLGALACRRLVGQVNEYLLVGDTWSRTGRNPKVENLPKILKARFFRWLDRTKRPLLLTLRIALVGFALPFAAFTATVFLWSWLFPISPLNLIALSTAGECKSTGASAVEFVWEHLWRGAAMNLPDAFGWLGPSVSYDPASTTLVATMRLYLSLAGAIALGQIIPAVVRTLLKSLAETLWIPLSKAV